MDRRLRRGLKTEFTRPPRISKTTTRRSRPMTIPSFFFLLNTNIAPSTFLGSISQ